MGLRRNGGEDLQWPNVAMLRPGPNCSARRWSATIERAMKSTLPDVSLPRVWCDFNACGLSGEPGDNCYYALHREQLAVLHPSAGMRLFIWDWSDAALVVGCEAVLERYRNFWRARPVEDTWAEGKPDETFTDPA